MSREANVFIPSLPFLIQVKRTPIKFHELMTILHSLIHLNTYFQVIDEYDFNKRNKAASMKPLSLMCMLKASKSQSRDNAYKDALIDHVYELILESAAKDSYCIYFPDMYVPCVIKVSHSNNNFSSKSESSNQSKTCPFPSQLKEFLKKCRVANYCRKMKQLLDKINESRQFLETERGKRGFDLMDMKDIEAWEASIKAKGTPASKFYDSWIKVHRTQMLKFMTRNDEEADAKLPTVRRPKKPGMKRRDSDEDSDLEVPVEEMERRLKKAKKPKKKAKKARKAVEVGADAMDSSDIVKDIKSSDWD